MDFLGYLAQQFPIVLVRTFHPHPLLFGIYTVSFGGGALAPLPFGGGAVAPYPPVICLSPWHDHGTLLVHCSNHRSFTGGLYSRRKCIGGEYNYRYSIQVSTAGMHKVGFGTTHTE